MATASSEGCGVIDDNPLALGAAIAGAIEASGARTKAVARRIEEVFRPITSPMDLGSAVLDVKIMTSQLRHNAASDRPQDWGANTAYTRARYFAVYDPLLQEHIREVGPDSRIALVRQEFLDAYEQAAKAVGLDASR